MIMMDLASRRGGGDKSHPEKRPAILYYEAHQVPLWVGTKYSGASRVHNLVWLTPPDDEFPLQTNVTDPEVIGRIDSRLNNQANPQNLVYGDVFAENSGSDAYGYVEFSSYYSADTSLKRRMILTAEGILVICDQRKTGQPVDG